MRTDFAARQRPRFLSSLMPTREGSVSPPATYGARRLVLNFGVFSHDLTHCGFDKVHGLHELICVQVF